MSSRNQRADLQCPRLSQLRPNPSHKHPVAFNGRFKVCRLQNKLNKLSDQNREMTLPKRHLERREGNLRRTLFTNRESNLREKYFARNQLQRFNSQLEYPRIVQDPSPSPSLNPSPSQFPNLSLLPVLQPRRLGLENHRCRTACWGARPRT